MKKIILAAFAALAVTIGALTPAANAGGPQFEPGAGTTQGGSSN